MKKRLMEFILGLCPEAGNRKSCLMMALQSARYHTGRDIQTGKADDGSLGMRFDVNMRDGILENGMEESEMFTGLVLYLILLEQMGILFGKEGAENAIKRLFRTIGDEVCFGLNEKQIAAVCDLRNTLAHNFGLATERCYRKVKEKKTHHKFTLLFNDDAPAVCLPEKEWDGCFSEKEDGTSTEIGIPAFCGLVEEVIAHVREACGKGTLELTLEEAEVEARFTVRV